MTCRRLAAALCCVPLALAQAAEERVVNVYNWADYIGPTTIRDFERETGIKVNYDTYDTSQIVDAKLLAGNTGYDVVFHSGSFAARMIPVGVFLPLDKSRLPNWQHLDPAVLQLMRAYDPELSFAVPFMWGTVGFAYNVDMVRERMPNAPLDSAALVFDPAVVSRFADCGVTLLDEPIDLIPMAMSYLGHPANSVDPRHLREAGAMLDRIRPYIKYFSSVKMLIDMPNKEICIGMSWSGDYTVAARRAREANIDIRLAYSMPKEGMPLWLDGAYIPRDAPHPDNAHRFIDFILRPEVVAPITDFTGYASANKSATPLIDPAIANDPAIYPTPEVMSRLHATWLFPPKIERERTRVFTRTRIGLAAETAAQ